MSIESATDRNFFFESDAFADTATLADASTVNGIFDTEEREVDTDGEVNVVADDPQFTCRTSDVSGLKEGDTLTIEGVQYAIRYRRDDGTGVTDLYLQSYDEL